jgi:hypothetical protein
LSESTVIKSKVFKEDVALATGGTGAVETGTRLTSTGGEITLTKIDAAHIKFRTLEKSIDDLVDGGKDIEIKPSSISMDGTLTNADETSAGYIKNDASGVYSGGNSIATIDLPTNIDAANIANGTVSNTEFQYLNGVTSNIQTQLNSTISSASKAEQETATEAAKYVAPATQQYHPSAAKAWAYCTVTGGAITQQAGYNVTVTRNANNDYTATFTIAFSTANYVVLGSGYNTSNTTILTAISVSQQVGSCNFQLMQYNGYVNSYDTNIIHIVFYGEQA